MNREIKFRAICDVDNSRRMLYFGLQEFDNGVFAWPVPDNVYHIDNYVTPLMQFTGLKDKNGHEIYEGDVVTCEANNKFNWPATGFVEFINGQFAFNTGKQEAFGDQDYYAYFWTHKNIAVIGNIYEHPELIKK